MNIHLTSPFHLNQYSRNGCYYEARYDPPQPSRMPSEKGKVYFVTGSLPEIMQEVKSRIQEARQPVSLTISCEMSDPERRSLENLVKDHNKSVGAVPGAIFSFEA